MNKELYFIPLIARALADPDPLPALRSAFLEIRQMGELPEFARAYEQFVRFMDAAARVEEMPPAELQALLHDLEFLLENAPQSATCPQDIQFILQKDNVEIGSIRLASIGGSNTWDAITPGRYRLLLETGRVLWEPELTEEDLLWTTALPCHPLEMAASTESESEEWGRAIHLLDGEVTVTILPGLDAGTLTIRTRGEFSS